jgi:septum formation protein
MVSGIDDDALPIPQDAPPDLTALLRARAKARDVAAGLDHALVIGADTVGAFDGRLLGKPENPADARRMLRALSGRRHEIISAMVIIDAGSGREADVVDRAGVTIRKMSDDAIAQYVADGLSTGKCAAYAIQNSPPGFATVDGRYSTVVGMPVEEVPTLIERVSATEA